MSAALNQHSVIAAPQSVGCGPPSPSPSVLRDQAAFGVKVLVELREHEAEVVGVSEASAAELQAEFLIGSTIVALFSKPTLGLLLGMTSLPDSFLQARSYALQGPQREKRVPVSSATVDIIVPGWHVAEFQDYAEGKVFTPVVQTLPDAGRYMFLDKRVVLRVAHDLPWYATARTAIEEFAIRLSADQ
jgi:hypothetical protein